jgi:hypothetical protein
MKMAMSNRTLTSLLPGILTLALLANSSELTGCSERIQTIAATAVVVSVYSEAPVVASLRVRVRDTALNKEGDSATYPIHGEHRMRPFSFTVLPPRGSNGGRFVVRVEGLDEHDMARIVVQAQATFLPGKTRLLTLWLAELCQDVDCADDQTCRYEADDRLAGTCGDVLNPKLTDFAPGADEDLSQFPQLAVPSEVDDGGTAGPGLEPREQDARAEDAGQTDADAPGEAGPMLPPAPNLPTIGSLRTLGTRRTSSDGSLIVLDDGFEESGRMCNPDGLCAVAGFVP